MGWVGSVSPLGEGSSPLAGGSRYTLLGSAGGLFSPVASAPSLSGGGVLVLFGVVSSLASGGAVSLWLAFSLCSIWGLIRCVF
jgi:hypothetical protein